MMKMRYVLTCHEFDPNKPVPPTAYFVHHIHYASLVAWMFYCRWAAGTSYGVPL